MIKYREEEFVRLILALGIGEGFLEVRYELVPECSYKREEQTKQRKV